MLNNPRGTDEATFLLAAVVSVIDTETVTLILDGMTAGTQKAYKVLSSAWPLAAGSRVVVMKLSGTYVVIGKIGPADGGGGGSSYVLPIASDTRLGGIKVGAGLSIDPYGILSSEGGQYSLPTATFQRLGGIKVGNGLSVQDDGTLSATGGGGSGYTLPPATAGSLGGIIVGSGLSVDQNGVLSASGGGSGGETIIVSNVFTAATGLQHIESEIAIYGKLARLRFVLQVNTSLTKETNSSDIYKIGTIAADYCPAVPITENIAFTVYKHLTSGTEYIYDAGETNMTIEADGTVYVDVKPAYNASNPNPYSRYAYDIGYILTPDD